MEEIEKKAVEELRERMNDDMEPELYDDIYFFHRFLKARDFNIDNAEIMLKNYLEWRKKNDVRNILQNFKKPEVAEKYCPYVFLGYDKEGCIIRFIPIGNMDFIGMLNSVKFEVAVKTVIFELENDAKEMKKQSEKLGRNIDKCVVIEDYKNISFAQVTSKKSIYTLIYLLNMYINNYPEKLKACFMINVPSYFSFIYNVLKSVLPKTVLDKFHIYSDNSYKEDLLKVIDADVLPAFLGGSRTDPDGNPLCHTFINHAGEPVPEKYFIHRSKRSLAKQPGVQKASLSRASFHEINLEVKEPGSYLEWEFETKSKDIGFGLFLNEIIGGEEKVTELVAIQRIDTQEYPETGTMECEKIGTYTIVFDNTYSWVRAKEIFYRVKIIPPNENQADDIKE